MSLLCAACERIPDFGSKIYMVTFIESDGYSLCDECFRAIPEAELVPFNDESREPVISSATADKNGFIDAYAFTTFRRITALFNVKGQIVAQLFPALAKRITLVT